MKRYLKLGSAVLALIGVIMMFFTQVTVKFNSGTTERIAIKALVGGDYSFGTTFNGVGSGLAGYILLGAGALIIIASALVPYFKEHEMLSMTVTGLGVICLIIGLILIFLIRKNFVSANGFGDTPVVYVGWAAITAGSLASVAALGGILGMILDLTGSN